MKATGEQRWSNFFSMACKRWLVAQKKHDVREMESFFSGSGKSDFGGVCVEYDLHGVMAIQLLHAGKRSWAPWAKLLSILWRVLRWNRPGCSLFWELARLPCYPQVFEITLWLSKECPSCWFRKFCFDITTKKSDRLRSASITRWFRGLDCLNLRPLRCTYTYYTSKSWHT